MLGCFQEERDLPSWGIAASSASGLILKLGNFGWFLALFFGFWILYSTAISNVDLVVRQSTDMLWFASDRVRKWAKKDIRRIYYLLLIVFILWGSLFINISASSYHLRRQRQYRQLYNGSLSSSYHSSE